MSPLWRQGKNSLFWRQNILLLYLVAMTMKKTIYDEAYRAMLGWLRLQRKQRGLTMRDLAMRIGVHHSWVGRIEQGERRLDISEFVRVCMAIGCDPYEGLDIIMPSGKQTKLKIAAESRATYHQY